jgi:hypothetical protein
MGGAMMTAKKTKMANGRNRKHARISYPRNSARRRLSCPENRHSAILTYKLRIVKMKCFQVKII